jgi:hypothetical protein
MKSGITKELWTLKILKYLHFTWKVLKGFRKEKREIANGHAESRTIGGESEEAQSGGLYVWKAPGQRSG